MKKHYVVERFGVHNTPEDCIKRDMIFDTGMLLGDTVKDHYSISSEKYFDSMGTFLSLKDMRKLAQAYLYGYITGNSDMHVKNFSVVFNENGFHLSPLYDLVSYKPYGKYFLEHYEGWAALCKALGTPEKYSITK